MSDLSICEQIDLSKRPLFLSAQLLFDSKSAQKRPDVRRATFGFRRSSTSDYAIGDSSVRMVRLLPRSSRANAYRRPANVHYSVPARDRASLLQPCAVDARPRLSTLVSLEVDVGYVPRRHALCRERSKG